MTNKITKTIIVSLLLLSATSIFADETSNPNEGEPMPLGCHPYPMCEVGVQAESNLDRKVSLWFELQLNPIIN